MAENREIEGEQTAKKPAAKRPMGLGRGLNSLFGDIQKEEPITPQGRVSDSDRSADGIDYASDLTNPAVEGLRSIAISDIRPNPDQPRQTFDNDALDELALSMQRRGVIQPIVVRPHGKNYQIVAGERRWRAAQRARLHHVPAIIRQLNDEETLEIAIVENVQRRDLNAIEEAEAYVKLSEDYGHSQARLAELVGKSRSHVANIMRLLELPPAVRALVAEEKLTMGHARALINAPNAIELANQAVKQGLSVRDVEKLVRKQLSSSNSAASGTANPPQDGDADIRAVENHLGDLLGLKVSIQSGPSGAGSMTINFSNLDQLDLICQRLTGEHI